MDTLMITMLTILMLMGTMLAVGATGGRPREPLYSGHRQKWRALFSRTHDWLEGCLCTPQRATAGRPYWWKPLR